MTIDDEQLQYNIVAATLSRDAARVMALFADLAETDADGVLHRAMEFLKTVTDHDIIQLGDIPAERAHHLTMDVFRESLLATLEAKSPEVECAVEHDIASWLEANAPAAASANVRLMEQTLDASGSDGHRDIIALHQLLDFDQCVDVQHSRVCEVWGTVERAIAERLTATVA